MKLKKNTLYSFLEHKIQLRLIYGLSEHTRVLGTFDFLMYFTKYLREKNVAIYSLYTSSQILNKTNTFLMSNASTRSDVKICK